jgi:hypothetical protein
MAAETNDTYVMKPEECSVFVPANETKDIKEHGKGSIKSVVTIKHIKR